MTILEKPKMSGSKNPYQLLKSFNFDGLEIEIIKKNNSKVQSSKKIQIGENLKVDRAEPIQTANDSSFFICCICLNHVANSKKVLLKCQEIFCSTCFVAAIIKNKDDIITCPSIHGCDTIISKEEILSIIGEENYEDFMLDKLEKKLDEMNLRMRLEENEMTL